MGSLYSLFLLALLLVTFVDQTCGSEVKNGTNHRLVEGNKAPKTYEEELEAFLRSVLKNGIPGLGIPTLDPLVIKDTVSISEIDVSGITTIEYLELGDFEVVGLSTFVTNSLSVVVLPKLRIALNFTFPIEVKAKHSNFSIIVGDLLPFRGEGPANLIADLRVEADIRFETEPTEKFLILGALSGDIFFDKLEVEFSTLFGVTGGKGTHTLNKFIGDIMPELIDVLKPYMIDGILESLLTIANEFLYSVKITLTDLLLCLNGDPACPFGLP